MKSKAHPQPNSRSKYRLTEHGYELLRSQLIGLFKKRQTLIEDLKALRTERPTDPVDTSLRISMISDLDGEITRLEAILARAGIIPVPKRTDTIQLGSVVELECRGRASTVMLVTSVEADPAIGRISNECPLGKVLVNRHAGETVAITTNKPFPLQYRIVKISA